MMIGVVLSPPPLSRTARVGTGAKGTVVDVAALGSIVPGTTTVPVAASAVVDVVDARAVVVVVALVVLVVVDAAVVDVVRLVVEVVPAVVAVVPLPSEATVTSAAIPTPRSEPCTLQ